MGTTVDSIEIQIGSDAKKAEQGIDSLVKKMDKLIKSMGSIDVSAISKQAKKISDSFSNVNVKGLENISKSAKQAEESVKKISSAAKSVGSSKMNFNVSDYQKVIKELSGKFADAGKGINFDGDLQSLEKQVAKLSTEFDKLAQKEEKILSVGKMSPQSTVFQNLQYDIALTTNKIAGIQDAMEKFRKIASAGNEIEIADTNNAVKSLDYFVKSLERFDKEILESENKLATSHHLETPIKNLNTLLDQLRSTYSEEKYLIMAYEEELKRVLELQEKTVSKAKSIAKVSDNIKWTKAESGIGKVSDTGWTKGSVAMNPSYIKKAREELEKYNSNLKNAGNESSNFANKSIPSFQKVTSALNSMGSGVLNFAKRITSMSLPFSNASKGSLSLTKSLGKLSVAFLSLRGIGSLVKKSIDISSSLSEVQNVIDITYGKYSKAIEDFAKVSITDYGMSELTAKQIAGRFQAMGTAIGYSQKQMSGMSVELTKLTADMASFYDVEQEDVAKSLESVFTGTTKSMRRYGIDLTNATLEEWAHKQGIDAKMRSMSQAEKTMLRYQYVMSQTGAAQGDFARTANTWANQIRILKQNFEILGSTIGGVLINALKPFVKGLNAIMGQINSFAKIISNALGKIFGWTYEEGGGVTNPADDMADGMEDVADATDKATKKQKEFNKQLSKFDELNNYTTSDKGGKDKDSGSGDLSGLGSGASGAWTQGESMIKAYESEIDSLYKLGKKIGDTLKKAMDSIDWDGVYKKAQGFGKGLANFLNGLISPGLFSSLGKTIAGGLNAALHFLNSFGTTFDWKNFGKSIAAGINSFFKTFDFSLLATTFNTWANGILTSMITAVQGVDWKNIASKIAELINGVDASGISWKLGKLAGSLANAFYQLVSNKDTWTALGTKIADGINGFFSGMNDVDPKTGLTGFQALGKNISESISGIATTITTALKGVDWTTVGQSIGDFIASIDFAKVAWDLTKLAANLFSAIVDAVSGFIEKAPLESAIVGLFVGLKLTGLSGVISTAMSTALAGKNLSLGKITMGLGLGLATFKLIDSDSKIQRLVGAPITAALATYQFTGDVKTSVMIGVAVAGVQFGFEVGKTIGEAIQNKFTEEDMSQYRYDIKITDLISYSPEEWKKGIKDMIDGSELYSTIQQMITEAATGNYHIQIGSFELPSWNEIKKSVTKGIDDVTSGFKMLKKDIKKGDFKFKIGSFELPSWNQITKTVKTGISDIKGAFNELWKDIKSGNFKFKIGSFELPSWNEVETTANTIWTNLKNWWNENVKLPDIKLPTIADIKKGVKDKWDNAKSWWSSNVKLPKINLPTIADIKKKIQEIWKNTKTWWTSNVKLPKISLPTIADIKGKIQSIWNDTKTWWKNHVKLPDIKFPTISTATVKSWLKPIVTVANSMIEKINSLMKVSWKDIKVAGKTVVPSGNFTLATIPKITGYETGGYPDKASLFWAGENGIPEIIGTKGGKPAVAGGVEITGIKDEISKASSAEVALLMEQNRLLRQLLAKDTGITTSEVFNAVRDEDNAFYKRNGHSAFSW